MLFNIETKLFILDTKHLNKNNIIYFNLVLLIVSRHV